MIILVERRSSFGIDSSHDRQSHDSGLGSGVVADCGAYILITTGGGAHVSYDGGLGMVARLLWQICVYSSRRLFQTCNVCTSSGDTHAGVCA